MTRSVFILGLLLGLTAFAHAQSSRKAHVGYLYPAGAQRGSTIEATIGGRNLRDIQEANVTGGGVEVRIVDKAPGWDQTYQKYLTEVGKMIRMGDKYEPGKLTYVPKDPDQKKIAENNAAEIKALMANIPNVPVFKDLKKLSQEEYNIVSMKYRTRESIQRNTQLGDLLGIEITVAPNAEPGMRELRLKSPGGLSNPIRFAVSPLPDVFEKEPNDEDAANQPPVSMPFVWNGQVKPGDVDRIRFKVQKEQNIVIKADCRALVPYLADAVPGWFESVITLYNDKGRQVSYAGNFRFKPDPVIFHTVPEDGIYELSIRDSIFRGREDFVYRVQVGTTPFVAGAFPLGGTKGDRTPINTSGWNLKGTQLMLDNHLPGPRIRSLYLDPVTKLSNKLLYAIDDLPDMAETRDNNTPREAEEIFLPVIINGQIEEKGDVDCYRFEGRKGQTIVIDVMARRLDSPMDSSSAFDPAGKVIASNDDFVPAFDPKKKVAANIRDGVVPFYYTGLQTHHADSFLKHTLPADGNYTVQISDTQRLGSEVVGYRLRVSEPRISFEAYATPSSLNLTGGCAAPLTVYVNRRDGFDGPIDIVPDESLAGFTISGSPVPAGCSKANMTLLAPAGHKGGLQEIKLWAEAKSDRQQVHQEVHPAEDVLQAFITPHVLESDVCLANIVSDKRSYPKFTLAKEAAVKVPLDGAGSVRILKPKDKETPWMQFEPYKPAEGLTVEVSGQGSDGITLEISAKDPLKAGDAGNVVVEAFTRQKVKGKSRRVSYGMLPVVTYSITESNKLTSSNDN